MVGKRGLIRIIEVSLAILIIAGIVVLFSVDRGSNIESDIANLGPPLLEEIAKDNSLRDQIVDFDFATAEEGDLEILEKNIEIFLNEKITKAKISYDIKICQIDGACIREYPVDAVGDLYASERLVSSSFTSGFDPKRVKIFLWRSQ
jgi:hypothetical protein